MQFYLLVRSITNSDGAEFYQSDSTHYGEPIKCPVCGGTCTAMEWLPPFQIELRMFVKVFGNIIFGPGNNLFMDKYFTNRFEQSGLTGLEFIGKAEIERIKCYNGVKKKSLGEPPQYYIARMKYGCAAIDHVKSDSQFKVGREPKCDYCRSGLIEYYPRVVIDETTWDGTDIFFARGIGGKVTCSQRFKDWWDSCHFNNGKLVPVEEYSNDFRWK
jgi:hypothetical protein